jgi:polyhydroxyalkanoate synthesis regulator phasin
MIRRIQALEAKQHRRIRELLRESDPDLASIDEQIDQLRKKLIDETETSEPEG